MAGRRPALAALALAAALAVSIPLGRLERARAGDTAAAGIAATRPLVGANLLSTVPERFFTAGPLTCLVYSLAGRTYSVSLCFDGAGRLVEATDARSGEPRTWSVRADPSLATTRSDPAEIEGALRFMDRRETVSRVAYEARRSLGDCFERAVPLDRRARAFSKRPKLVVVPLVARAARVRAKFCRSGAARYAAVRGAYGSLRTPMLWRGVRENEGLQEELAAELDRFADALRTVDSEAGALRVFADFRSRFAAFEERIRAADRLLAQALVAVRHEPGGPRLP